MKPIVDEVAKRLRDELCESIEDFEGLYVFGSQVRGDATPESDVDIVVLFGKYDMFRFGVFSDIMSAIELDYYNVIELDVLRYTREELERNYIFHNEVVNKGIFYGAR